MSPSFTPYAHASSNDRIVTIALYRSKSNKGSSALSKIDVAGSALGKE
jgi:hypothetical protein